jgi:hypothetical protein
VRAAKLSAWSFPLFNCPLTAPHSSNHKDSQMLLCNIRESKTANRGREQNWKRIVWSDNRKSDLKMKKSPKPKIRTPSSKNI